MTRVLRSGLAVGIVAGLVLVAAGLTWPSLSPSAPSGGLVSPPPRGSPPPPGNGLPPAGNNTTAGNGTRSPLVLTLLPSASSFRVGEPVTYVLTVTNVGTQNESLTLEGCDPWLVVSPSRGAEVYNSSSQICPMVIVAFVLAPGQSWSRSLSWSQGTSAGSPVPAGSYRLVEYWDAQPGVLLSAWATVDIVAS